MHSDEIDKQTLQVVADFADELKAALDSLGDKEGQGLFDHYRFFGAKHIQRAVDGFVFLRSSGRIDSSKFLVRPAMEVVFKLQAIEREPELLYRIAYSEHLQDNRMFRPAAIASKKVYDQDVVDKSWHAFSDKYKKDHPKHQFVEEELKVYATAEKAGLIKYYDSHYRTYSLYIHGSFRATTGSFDDITDPEDNRAMALAAWVALETLIKLGAGSPNHDALVARLPQKQGTD